MPAQIFPKEYTHYIPATRCVCQTATPLIVEHCDDSASARAKKSPRQSDGELPLVGIIRVELETAISVGLVRVETLDFCF